LKYDVIIAGGSFAGLALARQLKGSILLIDRKKIGTGQTSACATFKPFLYRYSCEDSILQEFNEAVLHSPQKTLTFNFEPPLCTFDYEKFCNSMLRGIDAEMITTSVNMIHDNWVLTDKGPFQSDIIVDATGWSSVLVSSFGKGTVQKDRLSFGYETELPCRDDKIHFYYEPKYYNSVLGWAFPCGEKTRFGVATYTGRTKLQREFKDFIGGFGFAEHRGLHGGYFPHRLRRATVDRIFVVGDAAGQCMPASGEGIRSALFFGEVCGKIIRKVLDGQINLYQALKEYRNLVRSKRKYYTVLFNFQRLVMVLPASWVMKIASFANKRWDFIFEKYLHSGWLGQVSRPSDP